MIENPGGRAEDLAEKVPGEAKFSRESVAYTLIRGEIHHPQYQQAEA